MRLHWWITALVMAASVALVTSWFAFPRPPNVLIIVVDTLRADHLGSYGYERNTTPVIDAFAGENIRFTHAVSAAPWTPPSVASILTGQYPSAHRMMPPNASLLAQRIAVRLDSSLDTLPEKLKSAGYQTGAITPNPWMREGFGFRQGFDHYVYRPWASAAIINHEARKLLEEFATNPRKPFFLYLHYFDPHDPYAPPPPFDTLYEGALRSRSYPPQQTESINLYDGEIRYVDAALRRLFAFLKHKNLYEDMVIVLVADHGEQFLERGEQGHGHHLYSEEIHVPLVLRAAGRVGEVDAIVSTVDIYPTILELAGIRGVHIHQGVSLLDAEALERRSGVFSEVRRLNHYKAYVARDGRKLIVEYGMRQSLVVEGTVPVVDVRAFDWRNDPSETNPITDPDAVSSLQAGFDELNAWSARLGAHRISAPFEMDDDTMRELRALGYID
jgi:arylsulfatase A-like enzyme